MANRLMFLSKLFHYAASCVWGLAGRAPRQSCSTLQMSLLCSVKMKRRQDGLLTTDSCQWGDTLALGWLMSGTEVTRAWLISPALAELLRLAREVTACTAFNYPVLSLAVSLSLIHSGVLSTAGKALLNTTCVEIHIKPKESRKQEQEKGALQQNDPKYSRETDLPSQIRLIPTRIQRYHGR